MPLPADIDPWPWLLVDRSSAEGAPPRATSLLVTYVTCQSHECLKRLAKFLFLAILDRAIYGPGDCQS